MLTALDNEAYRYWDTMSKIHYKTGNGNAMAEVYKEAIQGILMSPVIFGKSLLRFMVKLA